MEVLQTLSHTIEIRPDSFRGDIREKAQEAFRAQIVGKCFKKFGEIQRVIRIISIEQKALSSTGAARYKITCEAVSFQVHLGDVMSATVVRTDSIGVSLKKKCVDIYIPVQYLNGAAVDLGATLSVRVLALKHENDRFCVVGEPIT